MFCCSFSGRVLWRHNRCTRASYCGSGKCKVDQVRRSATTEELKCSLPDTWRDKNLTRVDGREYARGENVVLDAPAPPHGEQEERVQP